MQTSTHSLKHKDGTKWSLGFFISTRLISLSLLSATIETFSKGHWMTAQILQCKTRNTEQPFYLSIKISCYLAVFFLSRKHRENFKYLDAIHYLIQYYKLVFKGKSEGDDTFFFCFYLQFSYRDRSRFWSISMYICIAFRTFGYHSYRLIQ